MEKFICEQEYRYYFFLSSYFDLSFSTHSEGNDHFLLSMSFCLQFEKLLFVRLIIKWECDFDIHKCFERRRNYYSMKFAIHITK